jgi:hypothetical protein
LLLTAKKCAHANAPLETPQAALIDNEISSHVLAASSNEPVLVDAELNVLGAPCHESGSRENSPSHVEKPGVSVGQRPPPTGVA